MMKNSLYRTLLLCVLAGALCQSSFSQTLQDDSLRANYLIRFVDFIKWDRDLNEPATIAVIGADPLYQKLQSINAARAANRRQFRIIKLSPQDDLANIDLLYTGEGQATHWPRLLAQAQKRSIVTVSDQEGFLDAGGLIEFTIQKNRLRFALNLDIADRYGVEVSSKLVQLAIR